MRPLPAPEVLGPLLFGRHTSRVVFRRDPDLRAPGTPFPCEAAFVAAAVEARRRQFSAGRSCARSALAALGWPARALLVGPGGAPCWPAGAVGSISHCRSEAVAAVARACDLRALGLDVETTEPFTHAAANRFCTAPDRAFRDAAPLPAAVSWAGLVFSAKEALLKAHYPLHGRRLEASAVAIRLMAGPDAASGYFRTVPLFCNAGDRAFCDAAEGRWTIQGGRIYCAVVVPLARA